MELFHSTLSCKQQEDISLTCGQCRGRWVWGGVADLARSPENIAAHHSVKLSKKCKLNLDFHAIFSGEHGFLNLWSPKCFGAFALDFANFLFISLAVCVVICGPRHQM